MKKEATPEFDRDRIVWGLRNYFTTGFFVWGINLIAGGEYTMFSVLHRALAAFHAAKSLFVGRLL